MNLLCVLWSHRWATVANPGEDPYQWCQRCQAYRSNARWPSSGATTGRGWSGGGGAELGGHGGFGGGGFDGGGSDGGGGPS